MNTRLNHGPAKIYQFPTGGRSGAGWRRPEDNKSSADLASSHPTEVAYSGNWYHEAAIQESKPVSER
jgi:hypothetical protein